MRYILPIIFFFLFVFSILFLPKVSFASVATQSGITNITVTISGNSLFVTGYIAPFASIALTINGNVITSTVADSQGNFSFSNIAIPKGASTICFDSVDYKNLGASEACISITPVNGVVTKTNVFLPPTLGVQRTQVFVGDNALAFGYGMPGASITVHNNGQTGCIVTADSTGYFQCTISIKSAGNYELFADAVLKGQASEAQLKKILIKGIVLLQPTKAPVVSVPAFPKLPGLFAIPWWVWLLLLLIVIILIIILLRRFKPELTPAIGVPQVKVNHLFDFLFKERKLHHWWMKGVGY